MCTHKIIDYRYTITKALNDGGEAVSVLRFCGDHLATLPAELDRHQRVEITIFEMHRLDGENAGSVLSDSEHPKLSVDFFDVIVQPVGDDLDNRDPIVELEELDENSAQMHAHYLERFFPNSVCGEV